MSELTFVPERTALINVDMQRFFVESPAAPPQGLELLERINRLSRACREAGVLVVHTRVLMRRDGSNLGIMKERVPPFIIENYTEGNEMSELHPSLLVGEGDVILDKPRYGAFTSTDLDLILRGRGIETVIISGIATNVCCETTAREAAQHDYRVLFLSDGTATMDIAPLTADQLQAATCATLGALFADITTVDEVIATLGKEQA